MGRDVATELQRFASVVEYSDDAILTKDRRGIITSWNPGAERIYGYAPSEAIGRSIAILIPPDREGEEQRILDRILAGDRVDHYETERVTKAGRQINVSITVSPLKDADGTIIGASVIARDITARRRLQRAQRFLAAAGALLDRSLDPHETLCGVAEVAVPDLGELCVIDLLQEDGRIAGAVATVGADPVKAAALEQLRERFPLDPAGPHPVARVLRTGQAEVLPELTEEALHEIAQSPEHHEFMRQLRYRSAIVVPLQARGRTLGALSVLHLGDSSGYGSEDMALVEELARRAAIALDNARLYAQLGRMREADRFLSESSKLLSGSLDYEETLRRVAELAVPAFADWCVVDIVGPRGGLERVALEHRDAERVRLAMEIERRYPQRSDATAGAPAVVRTGHSELYPEITDEMLAQSTEDPEHLAALRQLGMVSAMIVPIVGREAPLGAITLVSNTRGQQFDGDDLEQAEELGRRAGIAIENARLYSERSRIARTLQASLLPGALPHVPGAQLASRFRPAGDGLEIGGDFYDVFPAADDSWVVAIGDVCGKGAEAAALTALARYTLRALAQIESAPADILGRLNQTVIAQDELDERFLTILLAVLRRTPGGLDVRLAAGGHPSPVRVSATGEVDVVGVPGTLIGVFPEPDFSEARLDLGLGDGLLFYTDGLTDALAPERILSAQDVALRLEVAGARTAPELVAAAEELAATTDGRGPRDDIAMVALHVSGD